MMARIFSPTACLLGEGPFWHPERNALFWFDILGCKMFSRKPDGDETCWEFGECVSAAGWIDKDHLLIASETGLFRFDLRTAGRDAVVPLEADKAATRSNDGRADPWGGFWIGTMGKAAEPGLGAIYRFYGGTLHRLYAGLTIPNAICFSPDRQKACFTDTPSRKVMCVTLDDSGFPMGEPETLIDLSPEGLNPDGAVMDADGDLWLAEWGAGRIERFGPAGQAKGSVAVMAPHSSCPAFGGPDMSTLFCTTAMQGMDAAELAAFPDAGKTFCTDAPVRGQAEHRVIL